METVAINLLWVSHRDQTGAFVYVKNLLDCLASLADQNRFLLIVRWPDRRFFKTRYGRFANIKVYVSDARTDILRHPPRAIVKLWHRWRRDEAEIERLIAGELNTLVQRRDVAKMFFPTQMIYPRGLKVQHYITVLDLQHEYLPENFSPPELRKRRDILNYIAKTARHLFAISEYTKQTIVEKLGLPPETITVTPLAPNPTHEAARPIELPEQFMFYPAAVWPHKNHRTAIEALRRLAPRYPDLHLVFSGVVKKTNLKEELAALADGYHLDGKVHFLGFVPDEVIEYLYAQAKVMIFPSSFEGFGMPILEAYHHRLPVVAARNSSIIEVAGDAAILCETNNAEEFAAAVDRLLTDGKIKERLKNEMVRQLKRFSWEETARKTLSQWQK